MKLFVILTTLFLSACSNGGLIIVNSLARFGDYKLVKSQAYGEHAAQKVDLYIPNNSSKGTVVFFSGGCWGACTTYHRSRYRFVAQAFTTLGYSVAIPDFRLYPEVEFPEIAKDGAAAISWISENITKFGGNADRLILSGHSSGGHIAAMLALHPNYLKQQDKRRLTAYIGLAAPYDFTFTEPYMDTLFASLNYEDTQPSHFVKPQGLKMLLLWGKDDTAVFSRNIDNMVKRLEEVGSEAVAHKYQGVDHAEILAAFSIPIRNKYEIFGDIQQFLKGLEKGSSPLC